jgi:hypothetical protein
MKIKLSSDIFNKESRRKIAQDAVEEVAEKIREEAHDDWVEHAISAGGDILDATVIG